MVSLHYNRPSAEGKQGPDAVREDPGAIGCPRNAVLPYFGEEGPGDKVLVLQERDPLAAV